jgi:hypothetical protein
MASHAPGLKASALPIAAVLASIPSYPRPVIERLVSRLIAHMGEQDGDVETGPWLNWEPPCPDGRHRDNGRGMCADCGAFL